jgi:glyoxylase-like metal-dependent hydrolase (beta-lactamase superfamily II)
MVRRSCTFAVAVLGAAILAGCGAEPASDATQPEATADPVGEVSDDVIAPDWCAQLPRAKYAELDRVDVDSDWFEVWEAGDGVLAIYEPKQWQEVISYLVLGDERALLFDTGMGIAPISEVVAQLTDLPVTVVNSHSHLDYVGGNAEFESVVGMDTDFTRERSGGLANERVRGEVAPDALCGPLPEGVTADSYVTRPWTITQVATDGHTIDLGGRALEILQIPGHTPDAIALLDAEAGYLWTGDSFYEGPIWLFAPETDLDAYEASIARLANLVPDLTRLLPAHNTPVADPVRLIELTDTFSAVRNGTLDGTASGSGAIEYDAGAFSILMAADAAPASRP